MTRGARRRLDCLDWLGIGRCEVRTRFRTHIELIGVRHFVVPFIARDPLKISFSNQVFYVRASSVVRPFAVRRLEEVTGHRKTKVLLRVCDLRPRVAALELGTSSVTKLGDVGWELSYLLSPVFVNHLLPEELHELSAQATPTSPLSLPNLAVRWWGGYSGRLVGCGTVLDGVAAVNFRWCVKCEKRLSTL
jgi:hypothetical protein